MTISQGGLDQAENGARDRIKTEVTHGAVGTGNTQILPTDNSLNNEVFRDSLNNKTVSQGQINAQFLLGATEANGNTLSEGGSFNQSTGGDLIQGSTFTATQKTNAVEIFIDFEIVINASQV